RWLALPMSEIVGCHVDLQALGRPWAGELAARIGDAATTAEQVAQLEARLARLAPAIGAPAPEMALAFRLLGRAADDPDHGIGALLGRLDISGRSLRRRCHEAFGYGPKTLDRILRFQRFLELAKGGEDTEFSGLAAAAGYADQAHLTREARRLSGLTPATILDQVAAGRTVIRQAA
ncbi:MAG: helix-turn-helix domain-containing protein, partial [Actinomycetes bacterium]